MLKNLNTQELLEVNGGCRTSDDPAVQAGLTIGCIIGRSIRGTFETLKNIKDIFF